MTERSGSARARVWTAKRSELLHRHFDRGLTAAQSAELIGGVTRDAVISKRRRLGLAPTKAARDILGALPPPTRSLVAGFPVPRFRCEPLPDMDLPAPPDAAPKRLADREFGECAWPLGTADEEGDYRTLFCCAPVKRGRPYCIDHAAVAKRAE